MVTRSLTVEEFCRYIDCLVDDLRETGKNATAEDFAECSRRIRGLNGNIYAIQGYISELIGEIERGQYDE